MPHWQVHQGADGGAEDQDPVTSSPISRPEPHWKHQECDQEERVTIHQTKLS